MTTTRRVRGRCLCGDVSYECNASPKWSLYCHCQSCRLNTASPATAFFGMADGGDNWFWTGQKPKIYNRNPGVQRFFCSTCGTPIAYRADQYPDEIHFYTASLEDATGFEPKGHVHYAERLPWHEVADNLPRWELQVGSKKVEN
ncbi:MAG: GFA family protein [Rhizobiaceae bacterium]